MPGWARFIAPGEESGFVVKFNTKGKSGRQSKSITVKTDDPQHKNFKFSLEGNIFQPIQVSPRTINIRTKVDQPVTKTAKIINNLDRPIALSEIGYPDEVTSEIMEVSLDKYVLNKGESAEFSVVFFAKQPGRVFKVFNVLTDYQPSPTVPVRVSANVEGGAPKVEATPIQPVTPEHTLGPDVSSGKNLQKHNEQVSKQADSKQNAEEEPEKDSSKEETGKKTKSEK